MLAALIVLAVVHVAGLVWLIVACRRAPEGYEDGRGFHRGRRES